MKRIFLAAALLSSAGILADYFSEQQAKVDDFCKAFNEASEEARLAFIEIAPYESLLAWTGVQAGIEAKAAWMKSKSQTSKRDYAGGDKLLVELYKISIKDSNSGQKCVACAFELYQKRGQAVFQKLLEEEESKTQLVG
jgi:hypothetical protein